MYQQKCPIYRNSKAVRDMVLLLMLAGRTRGTKGNGRNERRQREEGQRDNQPDDKRLEGVRRVAGVISRHGRQLLDGEVRRDGSLTAMDGATAPGW